jgi:hypothetical protein
MHEKEKKKKKTILGSPSRAVATLSRRFMPPL